MNRKWLVSCLLVYVACSSELVRSGANGERSGLSRTEVTEEDALVAPDGERPRLLFRCEAGQIGAYIIIDGSAEAESGRIEDRAVRVELDSAPTC